MRNSNALATIPLLLFLGPCFAQRAAVNIQADAGLPRDFRPFGKYLVEICALSNEQRTLTCAPTPLATGQPHPGVLIAPQPIPAVSPRDQTITLSLSCDPTAKGECNPAYPVVAGKNFFVSATADSGGAVRQTVLSGPATPVGGTGTVEYRANGPGLIIIEGTLAATPPFAPAAPVDLLVQVVADQVKAAQACQVLPAPTAAQSTLLDAPTIVSLLGNPTPFLLAAQGPNTIAVYSTRQPLRDEERTILNSFRDSVAALAGRTAAALGITPTPAKPFSVELSISHATALGDLATRVNGLNYSQFTVQDVGSDKIRVTGPTPPDCDTWKGFLTGIRHMEWQLISEPMSAKLFYLSSSDLATAFTGLAPAAAPSTTPTAPTTPTTPAAPTTPTTPTTPTAATTPATPTTPAATPANATIAVTQPPGSNITISSDTTPCVVAGLAFGNSSACGAAPATAATPAAVPTSSAAPTPPSATPAPKAPLAMASVAVAMAGGEQTPPDVLVFSDTNPGDDAQIQERLRVIAQLDLPRPEMSLGDAELHCQPVGDGSLHQHGQESGGGL